MYCTITRIVVGVGIILELFISYIINFKIGMNSWQLYYFIWHSSADSKDYSVPVNFGKFGEIFPSCPRDCGNAVVMMVMS